MGYRFDPSEPFTAEFRRIATGQLKKAVHLLLRQPGGLDNSIHAARKCFKRLRGLYRIIEKDAPAFRRAENARLRDAARSLSVARDAAVVADVAASLQRSAANNQQAATLERTARALIERRDRIVTASGDIPDKASEAAAACAEALEAVRRLRLDDGRKVTSRRIARAWERSLKKARHAQEACESTTGAAAFHELRKCCQTHRFYIGLLQPLWPSAMRAKGIMAKELAERLGEHNDLAVFAQLMTEDPGLFGTEEETRLLAEIVGERQARLRKEALKAASRVFGGNPKKEAVVVATLWRNASA